MLAVAAPTDGLTFPYYASAKLDGIRCLIKDGVAVTRKLEPIPNLYVQRMLGHPLLNGLDGELCVGPPYADDVFNITQSGVMSVHGTPDFLFHVFDYWNGPEGQPYSQRHSNLVDAFGMELYASHRHLQLHDQMLVRSMEQLSALQEDCLELGYEGLIIRSPDSPYKFGRSTAKQGWMMKIKRFVSGEARIVGFNELMTNLNDLDEDALGLAKRSSAQGGLVPGGVLGSLAVEDCASNVPFAIGTGYDAQQRADLWSQREQLLGKIVRYKHFEVGVKTAPRFPVFLGFRDERDMGDPAV